MKSSHSTAKVGQGRQISIFLYEKLLSIYRVIYEMRKNQDKNYYVKT